MEKRTRVEKVTVEMCFYRGPRGECCAEKVTWKLKPQSGLAFKVCDNHLAYGIRYSGAPAYVEEYPEDTPTQRIVLKER